MFWLKLILGFVAIMFLFGGAMYLFNIFMNLGRKQ